MQSYFENLNIIDLISEKHAQLRKMVRDTWVEQGNHYLTDTESYILALVERSPMTVAQLARIIDISRQGAHKCVQGLISKGYIKSEILEGNCKNKVLTLTQKGILFRQETLTIKEKFEQDIKTSIGEEHFNLVKQTLQKTWFPE
ncbi:helix-turn-helix domain-containing protein [Niameybacter massiliensis]|uniref:Helix-turn-helix domain-containing protein n=1 Tax=Holtiella tumoricola TaxID=3018743 RepID=A0AA42DS26_9FIRM|nr:MULTISPECIES: helix-turn-helix domain-containing protein [Lachnospirales]MDA3733557.1 helix-turn-helix domain-containing protein [Holtiella tumoricola]